MHLPVGTRFILVCEARWSSVLNLVNIIPDLLILDYMYIKFLNGLSIVHIYSIVGFLNLCHHSNNFFPCFHVHSLAI